MSQNDDDKDQIIASQKELIESQSAQIALLEKKVEHLIRVLFGSKSEKLDPAQLELLLDPDAAKKLQAADCDPSEDADAQVAELKAELKPVRRRKPRQPRLPANLPTVEEVIIPVEVLDNPQNYRRIGERISERLDVEPGRYTRRLIIRPTYVEKDQAIPLILTAPLPPTILEGSILTPSLLANIITAKYWLFTRYA